MQNTRSLIIEYFSANQRCTATEISHTLGMTKANIRHHLSILEKEGQIEVIGSLPKKGKGRPTMIYMLSRKQENKNISSFTNVLLNSIKELNAQNRNKVITNIVNSLAGSTFENIKTLPLKLNDVCLRLDELGYQAQWEAHKNGPIILLGKCPYSSIIKNHPELCEIDQKLIGKLTDSPCSQSEKLERTPTGSMHCIFQLQ